MTKLVQKEDKYISLQLWDTAGAERYNSLGQTFYRNAEVCVLVFDLTNKESFNKLDEWKNEFLNALNPSDPETYPFVLFGNKCDLKDDIKVSDEEIENYRQSHNNIPYFATSAKNDTNLNEGFSKIADLAFERYTKGDINLVPTKIIPLKITKEEPRKCCGR